MAKRRGKGEGSVYQRKSDKRWVGSFIVENGSRKYVYGDTRKEAFEKLRKGQREYQQGMLVVGPQQTVKLMFLRILGSGSHLVMLTHR